MVSFLMLSIRNIQSCCCWSILTVMRSIFLPFELKYVFNLLQTWCQVQILYNNLVCFLIFVKKLHLIYKQSFLWNASCTFQGSKNERQTYIGNLCYFLYLKILKCQKNHISLT